jgi:seryl-tRNA synthetase
MLDIKFIRENADRVRENCKHKNDTSDITALLSRDSDRRSIIVQVEDLKANRNAVSQRIAEMKRLGEDASDAIEKMRAVSDNIKQLDDELRAIELDIEERMLRIPNMAHESVPVGRDASDNTEVRRVGSCAERGHRVDHIEVSRKLGVLDFERAAKVSGSGFAFYVDKGAKLERALLSYFLDVNTEFHGYTELMPPFMVNADSLRGTGQLPKSQEDMYHMERDDLYMIPTAEVPITNFHRDEILNGDSLPIKYCGYSACFRREAGSHGKDTRGFLRVHQFNKIELVKFVKPQESYNELEQMVGNVEYILQQLGFTYRVLLLCTGDMTFGGAKTYDLEVWSPFEQRWLEVSSCTNFESYQARRASIRFKDTPASKPEFVHTLNGSGLATSRIMVALLEQYQNPDGTITIPEVLRPYCGFDTIA